MDKIKEIINYLLSARNIQSIMILIVIVLGVVYSANTFLKPKIDDLVRINNDISTNKDRYEGLVSRKKAKDLEEKKSLVKFDKVPVKIYRSTKTGLPIESASIDFVTKIIGMLEQTDNDILDISYKIDPLNETEKLTMPSTVSVVQLDMTLNGTYTSFQDFVYTLYGYDYLATIKAIKVIPLKENKNILEINVVLWLYVTR